MALSANETRFRKVMQQNGLWKRAQKLSADAKASYLRGARQVFYG